ncbi:hypothetical protein QI442_17035, partial [Staphylococcus aureus]|nr:hypothetical protein [Staphylococcus aureus]
GKDIIPPKTGGVIDVPTPNIDAVIVIASTILERDFFEEGLTVEEIGLDKLDLEKYLK